MQLTVYRFTKMLRIMKLVTILIFAACLQVSAKTFSQITLSETNAPLQKVFKEIKKQSGYNFLFQSELIEQAGNVTVRLRNVTLQKAIEEVLKDKELTYELLDKTVVIKKKEEQRSTNVSDGSFPPLPIDVK